MGCRRASAVAALRPSWVGLARLVKAAILSIVAAMGWHGGAFAADVGVASYFRSLPAGDRILHGVEVDGRYRRVQHIVALRGGTFECAATLIEPDIVDGRVIGWNVRDWPLPEGGQPNTIDYPHWAVTAAHCVVDVDPGALYVISGALQVGAADIGIRQPVSDVIRPDGRFGVGRFGIFTRANDIALLYLAGPVPFGDGSTDFRPHSIGFPEGRDWMTAPYAAAIVAGWGLTETGEASGDLLETVLPLVDMATCAPVLLKDESTHLAPPANTLCAGFSTGGYDSCTGDSGGPLFHRSGKASSPVLLGVLSWGTECSAGGSYGVYTDVAKLEGWMKSMIEDHLKQPD